MLLASGGYMPEDGKRPTKLSQHRIPAPIISSAEGEKPWSKEMKPGIQRDQGKFFSIPAENSKQMLYLLIVSSAALLTRFLPFHLDAMTLVTQRLL